MLAITPEALAVIQRVSAHPRMEPTSGLRITDDAHGGSRLQVRVVDGPAKGDSLVERDGGKVYLGPGATRRLEGHELDAVTDRTGRVQFVLRSMS